MLRFNLFLWSLIVAGLMSGAGCSKRVLPGTPGAGGGGTLTGGAGSGGVSGGDPGTGGMSDDEQRRTFNCGVGFVLIVAPQDAADVLSSLLEAGEDAFVCGELAAS